MADKAAPAVKEKNPTCNLTFAKADEIAMYRELVEAAKEKDYTPSKFIVRVLMGKETFGGSE